MGRTDETDDAALHAEQTEAVDFASLDEQTRRLTNMLLFMITVGIGYEDDVRLAMRLLEEAVREEERVLTELLPSSASRASATTH